MDRGSETQLQVGANLNEISGKKISGKRVKHPCSMYSSHCTIMLHEIELV